MTTKKSDVKAILAQIKVGYIIPIRTRHQPEFVPGEVLDIREFQSNKFFQCNVGNYKHFVWVGVADIDIDNVEVHQTPIGFYDSDKTDSGDEMEGAVCLDILKERQERKKVRKMRKMMEANAAKYRPEKFRPMVELDKPIKANAPKEPKQSMTDQEKIAAMVHETDITEDPNDYIAVKTTCL